MFYKLKFITFIIFFFLNKKQSDDARSKSGLSAGCLRALTQRKLENTQQRATILSAKASVWSSTSSQSNIWKQFFFCNNKNMQHPRFQAQHSSIKPHCPLWSGLRKEAYTEIQFRPNASTQRLHSMRAPLTEPAQPWSDSSYCGVISKYRR